MRLFSVIFKHCVEQGTNTITNSLNFSRQCCSYRNTEFLWWQRLFGSISQISPALLKGNEADKSLLMLDLAPSTIPNLQLFFAMHFKPDLCLSLGPIQEEINPTHLLHLHLKGHFLLDTNKTEDVNAVKVEIPFYHKLWFLRM